jgi:Tetracyclin repressor-like, C-terminal domain
VTAATSTRARRRWPRAGGCWRRRGRRPSPCAAWPSDWASAPLALQAPPRQGALEAAIITTGLEEAAEAFEAAVDGADEPLPALAAAYRGFALAHPHLYRLMNNGPLPRRHLPPGLEDRTAAPVLRVAGSQARARALWAFTHGMVMLELDHRFPPDADLDRAWQAGIAAFQPA